MTMDRRIAVFRGARFWLMPSLSSCPVHNDPAWVCEETRRDVMQARTFMGRLVVAVTCGGAHEWERVGERISATEDAIVTHWRCRRHPQHPVWCLTVGADKPPAEATA